MPAPSIGGAHTPTDPGTGKVWGSDNAGNAAAVVWPSPAGAAFGAVFEPFSPLMCGAASAPTTQSLFGTSLYATSGSTITGIKHRNGVAASGSNPTTVRFGLADNTGKIVAVSGNYGTGGTNNATTVFAAGANSIPIFTTGTTKYVTTYSGVYILCFVVNGVWGTTQPTPLQVAAGAAAGMVADGSNPPPNFNWATQTDLPAVNSSVTMTTGSTRSYWLALY